MYEWNAKNGGIEVKDVKHFDPVHTFECGQCFRWNRLDNGNWAGVVKGLAVELDWDGKNMFFHKTSEEEFLRVWYPYFDLGRDYGAIKEKLVENDPVMAEAINFGQGMRLLKQDFHEMLISFLISQNNGIPRIRKIIESLSLNFGKAIEKLNGTYYAFPDLERLAGLSLEDLKIIKAGYRDKFITKSVSQIFSKEVDMNSILGEDTKNSREEILKLFGVGEKVADCILLFSGIRYDIFPVDRWVRRVMAELYLGYEGDYAEIYNFALDRFGGLAGFAQQYLFYYAREKKIGL